MGIVCCLKRNYSNLDEEFNDTLKEQAKGIGLLKIKKRPQVTYKNGRWIYAIDNMSSLVILNDAIYTQEVEY